MGGIHESVKDVSAFHQLSGGAAAEKAAEEQLRASGIAAGAQQQAADFLTQRDKLPRQLRKESLQGLGGLYGLPGFEDTLDLVGTTRQSPVYQAMIAEIEQSLAGEEHQLGRTASSQGFLRSGPLAAQLASARGASGVAKAQALGSVYQQNLQGIQGLSQLPSQDIAIAKMQAGIGETIGQGITGSQETLVQGQQQKFGAVGNMFGSMFSDARLKENIIPMGSVDGLNWYKWTWNDKAEELGLTGCDYGVIAQEVQDICPDAISEKDGYLMVDYSKLEIH